MMETGETIQPKDGSRSGDVENPPAAPHPVGAKPSGGAKLFTAPFLALLAVQFCSLLGSAVLCFACPLYLLEQTGSAAVYGMVSAGSFIPYVILAPIGGTLADRADQRRSMAALDILLAAATGAFLLAYSSASPIVSVTLLLCVLYGAQAVFKPIVQTAVADIVGRDRIEQGIALVSQVTMGTNILGPVLGAAVYGFFGVRVACAVAVAGFALAAVLAATCVRLPERPRFQVAAGGLRAFAADYAQAAGYLRRARALCTVIMLAAAFNLVLAGATIGIPVIVTQYFKLTSAWVGTIEAGMGAGGLVGGLMVSVHPGRFSFSRMPRHVACSMLGVIPPAFALCLGMDADAVCKTLLAGLTWLMVWDSVASIEIVGHVQQSVPRSLCGKVLALMYAVLSCATPLGQLVYGAAYEALSPATVYVCMVGALAVLTVAFLSACRRSSSVSAG